MDGLLSKPVRIGQIGSIIFSKRSANVSFGCLSIYDCGFVVVLAVTGFRVLRLVGSFTTTLGRLSEKRC